MMIDVYIDFNSANFAEISAEIGCHIISGTDSNYDSEETIT